MASFGQQIIVLALVLITSQSSVYGATPPIPLSNEAREYLEAHNQARAAVGVGALTWSDTLATQASKQVRYQRDKKGCQFAAIGNNNKYGANQMWASGASITPRMVVNSWVAENKYYNHANNTCLSNHQCGVYTQVVWKKSMELGCAQATCDKINSSLTICFYNPPGNYNGESPY